MPLKILTQHAKRESSSDNEQPVDDNRDDNLLQVISSIFPRLLTIGLHSDTHSEMSSILTHQSSETQAPTGPITKTCLFKYMENFTTKN